MEFVSYEKLVPVQQVLGSYGFDIKIENRVDNGNM